MSTRSQKRKIVEELVSGEFESSIRNSNNIEVEQVPGPSRQKSPKVRPENLDEIKSSLKNELMSDLAKILSENQKEIMKMIAPAMEKKTTAETVSDTVTEEENISTVVPTSTLLKSGKEKKKQIRPDSRP